jgi:transposase
MPGAMHSASGAPGFDRIEVFTGVERRRRWSLGEKLKTVEESRLPAMSVSYVARKYSIAPSLLFRWRKLMAEGGQEAVRNDDAIVSAAEVKELKKGIRELERVLGKKTLENEILTEAVKLAMKKLISRMPLLPQDGRLTDTKGFLPCLTAN